MKRLLGITLVGICGLNFVIVAGSSSKSSVLPDAAADHLHGGSGNCWKLGQYSCPYITYSCGSIPCSSGLFSWYCPSGTYEQTAALLYEYCTSISFGGNDDCFVPNQQIWQVCAVRQACANGCLQSAVDGKYYCDGPVGPTWDVTIFPVHALSTDDCPVEV